MSAQANRWLDALDALKAELQSGSERQSLRLLSTAAESPSCQTDITDETPPEIAWRIKAMRPQVPPRGPIPMLHARPDAAARDAPGCCWSCGEPREEGQRWVCRACQAAKWAVLNEQREGLVSAVGAPSRNEG